ncbi:MAG TPA: riboflavin synthase [Candidatus Omnitrophota bacterium]|nr:riboflavin synthase [Candidatus Omnitrophota bacterium]HRZ66940.1 riboflavin synthase [Candidatus Omnitrophota bacterium]
MFTGIIEEIGTVEKFEKSREPSLITIRAAGTAAGLKAGDSVSVDGVCLTVVKAGGDAFSAEAVEETLKRTTLNMRRPGDDVNLEGALKAGSKISGHFVTGHIDGTGEIVSATERKGQMAVEIRTGKDLMKGIVPKGSIAVDGISLTVGEVKESSFSVYIIPHTAGMTTLASKKAGDKVNLETDILGKYINKSESAGITMEFLREKGFI